MTDNVPSIECVMTKVNVIADDIGVDISTSNRQNLEDHNYNIRNRMETLTTRQAMYVFFFSRYL